MAKDGISSELRQFIFDHVDSVEIIEILLFIQQNADQAWTAPAIAGKLYIQPESAADRLNQLVADRLCVAFDSDPPEYRYGPQSPSDDRLVRELQEAYRVRRVSIITLIFSKPSSKLGAFSDAFRIRRND